MSTTILTAGKILSHELVYAIASKALCDPRTVRKALRGVAVRPLVAMRIIRAADELGETMTMAEAGGGTEP